MLQTSFLIAISKGGVWPKQTPVLDFKCCKRDFSFPLTRGVSYPNKLQCMTPRIANVISHSISKGVVLPNEFPLHHSKCCKCLFTFPLEGGGGCYPTKLICMTRNVTNVFSCCHLQRWSLTQTNSSTWLQVFKTWFLIPISKWVVSPKQFSKQLPKQFSLQCMTPSVVNNFSHSH